jgi:hypothetical protein
MTAGGIESVEVLGNESLRVTMLAPQDSVPRILADPTLGILHGRGSILGRADRFLIPIPQSPPPAIEFRVEPGTDPRDALDHGADVLVTRDPALVDYVSNRPEFTSFPLPWSRTYVLLQPTGAGRISGVFGVDSVASSLARDVARTEARPAQPPFWWRGPQACLVDLSFVAPQPTAARILYSLGDEVAKSIAERIVALAETRLRATGLSDRAFAAALREQGDLGYIVALPRQVSEPCRRSQALPHGAWIQPLIDTRARAIVRKGVPPLTVEWDGTLRLVQP